MIMQATLRQTLKRTLPTPIKRALVRAENYVRRLFVLASVARNVRGRSAADARVV